MRIVCPSCTAAYDVPASVVAARRTMRCARCATEFAAEHTTRAEPQPPAAPAPSTPQAVPPARPAPEPRTVPELRATLEDRPAPPQAAPRVGTLRKAGILTAWAVSLLLLAGAGWMFLERRAQVTRAWPAASRIYALLGQPS